MRRIVRSAWALLFCGLAPVFGCQEAAAPANAQAGNRAKGPHFDGVYAAALDAEKDAAGKPRWIVVRLYEDGSTVEAEFHGAVTDCASWLTRDNEQLFPGRWKLEGDQLTVLESTGLEESERSGSITDQGWATTPTVTVRKSNGWRLEPVARAGGPPIRLQFTRLQFAGGGRGATVNRRPFFEGVGEHNRALEYDRAGNLAGISEQLSVKAADLDQDPLSCAWKASNGTVNAEGCKGVWRRELANGEPAPGMIAVEIADGRGGRVTNRWDSQTASAGGWALYQ